MPGIHQQQVDLLGCSVAKSPLSSKEPSIRTAAFVPGTGEDTPRGFQFETANKQSLAPLSVKLGGIHLAQQASLVDDAYPVRQAGNFAEDMAGHEDSFPVVSG